MTKKRVKTDLTYIAQPFVYGSSIRLLEDIDTPPMYKTFLHMNKMINGRKPSIRTTSSNVMANINDVISSSSSKNNTFSKDQMPNPYIDEPIDMSDSVDRDLESMNDIPKVTKPAVTQPIYFFESPKNKIDLNDLEDIKEKLADRIA